MASCGIVLCPRQARITLLGVRTHPVCLFTTCVRACLQHLTVRKIATGEQYTTRRTWARVRMTHDDQLRLVS